jgi:predicted aldo/keto reductase-like oxidoreductase
LYFGIQEPDPAYPMTRSNLMERVDGSLKRLNTDYIDFLFIHNVDTPIIVKNEELQLGFEELKKAGKIRFSGISTHNAKEMLRLGLEPAMKNFMQGILFMYNHMEGKEIEPLMQDARNAGIGTIAMKVLAGGKQGSLKSFIGKDVSYPQAAVCWALSNKNLDCAVMSMVSYFHVEEYVAASGKKLDRKDIALLKQYQREVDSEYCRVSCNQCESACPNKVAISDIMRYEMYFKDYGHQKAAIDAYIALENKKKPYACNKCPGHCDLQCPFGIKVKERLIDTHKILTT